ncbi:MAG: hypothetical protein AAF581_17795 [Planctomycetota bacterium]
MRAAAQKRQEEYSRRLKRRGIGYGVVAALVALCTVPLHAFAIVVVITTGAGGWFIAMRALGRLQGAALLATIGIINGFVWDWPLWHIHCCAQVFLGGILGVVRESEADLDC